MAAWDFLSSPVPAVASAADASPSASSPPALLPTRTLGPKRKKNVFSLFPPRLTEFSMQLYNMPRAEQTVWDHLPAADLRELRTVHISPSAAEPPQLRFDFLLRMESLRRVYLHSWASFDVSDAQRRILAQLPLEFLNFEAVEAPNRGGSICVHPIFTPSCPLIRS
jgi:hypothetical protein